ncbi:MAG: UpxY family transcription antiterminator [Bacteroidia bacterium]
MSWKVIYTASRQEKKLAQRLTDLGIEVYLPIYRKLSQWSDRKKWVDWPLFSGYLFVRPTEMQRDQVLQQHGAIAYLRFSGEDATVTSKEISIIEQLLKSGYTIESMSTPSDFVEGSEAIVMDGPLKGYRVEVLRRNNEDHILVSFETLGQSIKINLPYQILKPTK